MPLAHTLRFSLFAALGLVPLSCAGSTGTGGDSSEGSSDEDVRQPRDLSCEPTDPSTGLATCDAGVRHRPLAVACSKGDGAAGGQSGARLPRATGSTCNGDPDCAQFEYGFCKNDVGFGFPNCQSGCATDSDCGPGSICLCTQSESPTGGECVPATCDTDADCPGSLCASYKNGCSPPGFACLTDMDECVVDADCEKDFCVLNEPGGARSCGTMSICGRPFLVSEEPRVPSAVSRCDWSDNVVPRLDHLTRSERAALAAHWTKLGQMEHASIAAFARFSLQLLSLGAPPELVEACTAALADETAHAKLCFGIASAYAGHAIGPGPLDVSSSLELTSLADIVDLVLIEGCIGETAAALDALESAETATDPVIRRAYTRIAVDEQRHATLAFRFVQWAIERDRTAVLPRLESALSAAPASAVVLQVVKPCLLGLTNRVPAA